MRPLLTLGVAVVALTVAGAAEAATAPAVRISGAAARIVFIPENRQTLTTSVLHANPRLPLKIRKLGDRLFINGDVRRRARGCVLVNGKKSVRIWGKGAIAYDDLPEVIIRGPMDVRLSTSEAVFGVIGRGASVDLTNQGCGDWTIANVRGRLRLDQAGSGDDRIGSAASADLSVAGSGDISTRAIRGGVVAVSSGSGDISVASVQGPLDVRVAGSGRVAVASGQASRMVVSIAGSGAVRLGGVAASLRASVAGSGEVAVARVTGPVSRRVFGPGEVRVGR